MRLFRSRGCPAKDDEYGNRLYELYQEDTDEGYVWFTDSDDECGYYAAYGPIHNHNARNCSQSMKSIKLIYFGIQFYVNVQY